MKRKFVMFLIALAGSFGIVKSQQTAVMVSGSPGWHKIGETTVDFQKDRDEVKVIGADRFSALKFKVTDAPIDLKDLEVWFENGTKQDVQVRTPIEIGKESRVIDLPGAQREINKIVFVYKTLPNRKDDRAHVEIYGLKTQTNTADVDNADRERARMERERMDRMKNPNPPVDMHDRKGWVKVGEANADLRKDRDVINVTNYNRFTAIKFFVTGASLEIIDLNVYFANGDKQDISVRSMIKEGGESRVIDLDGKTREIKRIEFVYKTTAGQGKDRAHVEIWAKGSMSDKATTGNNHDKGNVNHNKNNNATANDVVPRPVVELNDKAGWHKIAENIVTFNKERDEVAILGADRFAKLKFKVTDAGIEISDMTITYEDGTKQDVPVKSTFSAGQESKVIDVPGREKDIAKISFVYKTIPNQGKDRAHVEIWGMKTNAAVGEHNEK